MMGVVPIIMKKIGVRNSLLLGATVMFARIGLCGVFHDPVTVSIVKLFHSIEVPLFCLPAFRYFTLHFDTKLSATLYMVGFQIASQVGQVIFSTRWVLCMMPWATVRPSSPSLPSCLRLWSTASSSSRRMIRKSAAIRSTLTSSSRP